MNTQLLKNGLDFLRRGWLPTPLLGKIPTLRGWSKLPPPTDGQVHEWVYNNRNLGVRTGNGLIIVDVDPGADPELLALLVAIRTPTVRTGRGGWHFYFKGEAKCSAGKISEHVDVRGDGGQAVMPGSIHPETGEAYVFLITPDEAELAPLPDFIIALIEASAKIRRAPVGKRNDTLNRATFKAASQGAPTRELADAAAEIGLDSHEIQATIISATNAAPRAPDLEDNEILVPGAHYVNSGEEVTVDQTEFVRKCWEAIPKGIYFNRFGMTGPIQDGCFQPVEVPKFRADISQYLRLYAYVKDGKKFSKEYRSFSADMASMVLAAGTDYTEKIEAICFYPLAEPVAKGWIVIGDHPTEEVSDHKAFWSDRLTDFPWRNEFARNHFVAAQLTLLMRHLIDGPTPMFMISATSERTGKTKLANKVTGTTYGRYVSNMALGDDDAEIDKRLVARAMGAHTLNSFDNIHGKINSPSLASYATSIVYGGRVLGKSQTVEFKVQSVTILTANNPSMSSELAKRMLPIKLESKCDHPEFRKDFKYPNLEEHMEKNRAKMLGSLLAMAKLKGPAFIMGGYEEWGRIVGGAMAAAGMPLSHDEFIEWSNDADDDSADARILVEKWAAFTPEQEHTCETLLLIVKELGIMPRVLDAQTERGQLIRLGNAMRGIKGRVFGNYTVTCEGTGSRRIWRLARRAP